MRIRDEFGEIPWNVGEFYEGGGSGYLEFPNRPCDGANVAPSLLFKWRRLMPEGGAMIFPAEGGWDTAGSGDCQSVCVRGLCEGEL
jgi:hypothetical protein